MLVLYVNYVIVYYVFFLIKISCVYFLFRVFIMENGFKFKNVVVVMFFEFVLRGVK